MADTVTEATKGIARLRRGKLRKWLQSKRLVGPNSFQRLIGFRTEACLGYNRACADNAPPDVLDELLEEYLWALDELAKTERGQAVLLQLDEAGHGD